ncbi:hypothetical protein BaRGS_00015989, partial [Batillaria attramentaria]
VERKRVIIRQGHWAENWYFIVTGQALVSELHSSGDTTRVNQNLLTRGMSFGLLVVRKEDYPKVFETEVWYGNRLIPQHIYFLKDLEFMKFWPWEKLLNYPAQCYQYYSPKDRVLVRDSTKSEWIYIIKSGICIVYMLIDSTRASWRDLQLALSNPFIDIDQWPGLLHLPLVVICHQDTF